MLSRVKTQAFDGWSLKAFQTQTAIGQRACLDNATVMVLHSRKVMAL